MTSRSRLFILVATATTAAGCGSLAHSASSTARVEPAADADATASMRTAAGVALGTIHFRNTGPGLHITAQLAGLPPGMHGIHLHAVGRCDAPDFASAGGHFNPTGREHGLSNPAGAHAGDLPMLEARGDGTASLDVRTTRATLTGSAGLLDADGTAVVIHAGPDDQRTDPSGNAGARLACGVVARAR